MDYDEDAGGAGKPGLVGGVGKYFTATIPDTAQPIDTAAIAKSDSVAGGSKNLYRSNDPILLKLNTAGPQWDIYSGSHLLDGTPTTAEHAIIGRHNGNTSSVRVDGSEVAAGASGTTKTSGTTLGLGAHPGDGAEPWIGYMRFFAFSLGVQWSAADLAALEAFLGSH